MSYRVYKSILSFIIHLFYDCKVSGADNVPSDGKYIICSNHISLFDFAFIGTYIAPQIAYLGKKEIIKHNIFAPVLTRLGFISVRRGESDVSSIKKVIETVDSGRGVLIFPQGTRKRKQDIRVEDGKKGIGLIQRKTGCNVIPVAIVNKKMSAPIFSKVYVHIGKPICSQTFDDLSNEQITERVMQKIIDLAEENSEYRDR